jgi:hypothetical protein
LANSRPSARIDPDHGVRWSHRVARDRHQREARAGVAQAEQIVADPRVEQVAIAARRGVVATVAPGGGARRTARIRRVRGGGSAP